MSLPAWAWSDHPDPSTPLTNRFGIEVIDISQSDGRARMAMPVKGLLNPFTDRPTIAPLAILVDTIGGLTNHLRCRVNEWTVTTELSLEMFPGGASHLFGDDDQVVVAEARQVRADPRTSFAVCGLACEGVDIGTATVRSFFVSTDGVVLELPQDDCPKTAESTLARLMAVQVQPSSDRTRTLRQLVDPVVNNASGVINGGIASAALEMAASAAMMKDGAAMHTASIRINFLRPFVAGERSMYQAIAVRIGSSTAIADAQAVGDDGRPALMARVTAYR